MAISEVIEKDRYAKMIFLSKYTKMTILYKFLYEWQYAHLIVIIDYYYYYYYGH